MTSVRIGRSSIGPGHPVYVIGEIGLNHNGDVDIAKRLIDVAVEPAPRPSSSRSARPRSRRPSTCATFHARHRGAR